MYLLTVETHSHSLFIELKLLIVVKQVEILYNENINSLVNSFSWVNIDTCLIDGDRLLSWEIKDSTYLALSFKRSIASIP